MTVADPAGAEVGTVSAVQQPGTHVRPEADADVEALMVAGYLRIDGTGLFSHDVYASGDQIVEALEGTVVLSVTRDQLTRAT
ncbi:hypothetical protein KOI35_39495 [Actinoplanes bogorensis]|uniref:PRC-barrel domain-containing protein n=2 Tax=Paractinoplanes bogorensis TaxID=1610840 RepID=A0ABS5Z1P8_9ACTN|nr:hypothetical protein [Actinoplanes bogorensis]